VKGGIGVRQKEVLTLMAKFGQGTWKANWHTPFHKREILESLVARDIVRRTKDSDGEAIYAINFDPREVKTVESRAF
jgi:hypothetical protein